MKLTKEQQERREIIFEILENQLRDHNPPETLATLQRLIREGYSQDEAKEMLAAVLASGIFEIWKKRIPFDKNRFAAALNKLPDLPE